MQIIFCYIRKQASLWQLCWFFGRKTNTGFARHPFPDDVFESFKCTQTDNKQSGCVHLTGAVVVRMDDHAASHKREQVVNREEALAARTGLKNFVDLVQAYNAVRCLGFVLIRGSVNAAGDDGTDAPAFPSFATQHTCVLDDHGQV